MSDRRFVMEWDPITDTYGRRWDIEAQCNCGASTINNACVECGTPWKETELLPFTCERCSEIHHAPEGERFCVICKAWNDYDRRVSLPSEIVAYLNENPPPEEAR